MYIYRIIDLLNYIPFRTEKQKGFNSNKTSQKCSFQILSYFKRQ